LGQSVANHSSHLFWAELSRLSSAGQHHLPRKELVQEDPLLELEGEVMERRKIGQ
jgi:hypothetical protein